MKIGELTTSKFLKGTDFPEPALCTIKDVTKENVAKPNEPKKDRGVMFFEEHEKGLVLNATNLKRAAAACGSDDTEDWLGKKIVVYYDENVELGGIRLRAPRQQNKPAPVRPDTFADMDDDVPF
jgi:hypothetical protein